MKITEWCPHCEDEVKLKNEFTRQICPKCGHSILPCSICEHTNDKGCHTKCDECPLAKLEGIHITSSNPFYENISVVDDMGTSYFLSAQDLTRILCQHKFLIEKKTKRTWLIPIFEDEVKGEELTEEETDTLSDVLDQFEHQTIIETAVRRISGGFANAEYSSCDRDWVYITLKWGVQNDVDNDVHEEDWKIARETLVRDIPIKEMVAWIIECN